MARRRGRERSRLGRTPPEAVDVPLWKEGAVVLEWLRLRASSTYTGQGIDRGDGSPVLVIPGFLCSDVHFTSMRRWLRRVGYRPYRSGIRLNAGCVDELGRGLQARVEEIHAATGRPPHLVGHSLGGLLARAVATLAPAHVASVVALGSPFRALRSHPWILATTRVLSALERLRRGTRPGCMTPACDCPTARSADAYPAATIPFTAIYTRSDGIVDWESCRTGDAASDVEVGGTHLGLMYNADAYAAIAAHLAAAGKALRAAA